MGALIYLLSYGLLLSCLLELGWGNTEQRFSLGLVRIIFFLPLLSLEYLYFSAYMRSELVAPLFFSENVFALTAVLLAWNLQPFFNASFARSIPHRLMLFAACSGLAFSGAYWVLKAPGFIIADSNLIFPHYGRLYLSSLFLLIAVLVMAWRLEAFWRMQHPKNRWLYKYMVIGVFLASGTLGWSTSLRLAYLHTNQNHFLLSSILLIVSWLLITYAVVGNRLLNRKIFVSRKVVYSTIAPLAFAGYLFAVGVISLLMRIFGWSMHFVLQWLLIIAGLLLIAVLAFSTRVRANVKYFISTHFYVNKYEYRDEWLAFSALLNQKLTESGVVEALRHILQDSLYTDLIEIWIGDEKVGFRLTEKQESQQGTAGPQIPPDDPVIRYLQHAPYLDCSASVSGEPFISGKRDLFSSMGLAMLVPLTTGEHFLGIIGLGPEYTGGRYGKDDFDLLAALGSHAASALLAVRTAEELARAREKFAWNTLSAFVLHDLKNAAAMLSLARENAPQHIHKAEFQQDVLVLIEDALKRITKVQSRLNTLDGEIDPVITALKAGQLVQACCKTIGKKLSNLKIDIECRDDFTIHTDPDFFATILENLLLNSMEAGGNGTRVWIKIEITEGRFFQMECTDNGPGIPREMLSGRLFEPFVTAKQKGSGIGLWQVKRLLDILGGEITAKNAEGRGAQFLIRLPV